MRIRFRQRLIFLRPQQSPNIRSAARSRREATRATVNPFNIVVALPDPVQLFGKLLRLATDEPQPAIGN